MKHEWDYYGPKRPSVGHLVRAILALGKLRGTTAVRTTSCNLREPQRCPPAIQASADRYMGKVGDDEVIPAGFETAGRGTGEGDGVSKMAAVTGRIARP